MESERDRKIRERAYELWVQSGRPEGSSDQHWFQAEQEYAGGSESPDASPSAGKSAAAKKTTRARSATTSGEVAPKPAAPRSGAKAATPKAAAPKTGSKGGTPKATAKV